MKQAYPDILRRVDDAPVWFTREGAPRFDEPEAPHLHPFICCQNCGLVFWVEVVNPVYKTLAVHKGKLERVRGRENSFSEPKDFRLTDDWYYGDPPRHGCVGDTMTSIPQRDWNVEHLRREHYPPVDADPEDLIGAAKKTGRFVRDLFQQKNNS